MKRTYQDFIEFIKQFETDNYNDFDEDNVYHPDPNHYPLYYYDAIFRDEDNYKTIVRIFYDSIKYEITWKIDDGWEDAVEVIEDLYSSMFH